MWGINIDFLNRKCAQEVLRKYTKAVNLVYTEGEEESSVWDIEQHIWESGDWERVVHFPLF